ncbi:MAG: hypothetical protein ACOYNL_03855, partial [Rickettsiales bacterium]
MKLLLLTAACFLAFTTANIAPADADAARRGNNKWQKSKQSRQERQTQRAPIVIRLPQEGKTKPLVDGYVLDSSGNIKNSVNQTVAILTERGVFTNTEGVSYSTAMQLRLLGLMGVGLDFGTTTASNGTGTSSSTGTTSGSGSATGSGTGGASSGSGSTGTSNGGTQVASATSGSGATGSTSGSGTTGTSSSGSTGSTGSSVTSGTSSAGTTATPNTGGASSGSGSTGSSGLTATTASTSTKSTTAAPSATTASANPTIKKTNTGSSDTADIAVPTTMNKPLPAKSTPTVDYTAQFGSEFYSVQAALDDMIAPNTQGMYPSLGPVSFPGRGFDHVWGADTEGNPNTNSYAYVDMKIRSSDVGPTGDGYNPYPGRTSLAEAGVGAGDTVRLFPWVVVGDAWQMRNTSVNTRVEVRNMFTLGLLFDGTWISGGENPLNTHPNTYGSWHSIFLGPGMASGNGDGHAITIGTGGGLGDGRVEPDGGSSLGSINMGTEEPAEARGYGLKKFETYVWHFYALPGFERTRGDLEQNFAGTITCIESKLILHDPNGPDDRNQSALLINLGADYYNPSRGNQYVGAAMHSRWKRIGNDWQLTCTTDISADALRK